MNKTDNYFRFPGERTLFDMTIGYISPVSNNTKELIQLGNEQNLLFRMTRLG